MRRHRGLRPFLPDTKNPSLALSRRLLKQALSADGTCIRANQGHSVSVDLALQPAVPPGTLFHGTVEASAAAILQDGIKPMARMHVHLSPDIPTARAVGARRGPPVILEVAAGRLHGDGHTFFCSENGVWLTDFVPTGYVRRSLVLR